MFRALVLAVALTGLSAAHAATPSEVISPAPDKVAVTIYRDGDGLAFVRETRTVDLPAGQTVLRFQNVADPIIPQSASIDGLPAGAVERNFDYNLLSAYALIDHAVGSRVRLVRTNRQTGVETNVPAILRAGPNGAMLEVDGALEALRCSGAPERIVFDSVPPTLFPSPTLSAVINVAEAGRYTLRLSYLTLGLTWQADYVARLRDDDTMSITAWVTLENDTSTTFGNAPTEVVAGQLSLSDDEDYYYERRGYTPPFDAKCWPINSGRLWMPPPPPPAPAPRYDGDEEIVITGSFIRGAPEDAVIPVQVLARQRELADYKLYELPTPTTVAAYQTKQVYFLDQRRVKFKRLYQFDLDYHSEEVSSAQLLLRIDNTERDGLGKPLPGGSVNVFEPARGGEIYLGNDDEVDDTPVGLPFDWQLNEVPNVLVSSRVLKEEDGAEEYEVRVTNAKSTAAEIELVRGYDPYWNVTKESKRHIIYQGRLTWQFRLRAGESTTLRYTITHIDAGKADDDEEDEE